MKRIIAYFLEFRRSGKLFYYSILILPLAAFAVFYIGVNINNILLAFKEYYIIDGVASEKFIGLQNFRQILINTEVLGYLVRNSFIYFAVMILFVIPLTMCFAYYIYKNNMLSGFFKVMIFLPSIVCSMTFVIFYKIFVVEIVEKIWIKPDISLLFDDFSAMVVMLALFIIMGFSSNILLLLNAMSSLDTSITESAKIDGAGEFRTFVSIIIPSVWGTLVSLLVIFMADFGINQANLNQMYGVHVSTTLQTLGFHIWSSLFLDNTESVLKYPYCSAFGVLLTAVIAPCTLIVRRLMIKFGPSEA